MENWFDVIVLLSIYLMNINSDFYERYVYFILRALLTDFPEMKKVDKPDYLSEQTGLEITRAIFQSDGEYSAFLEQFMNKPYSSIPKKRLTSLGFNCEPKYNREMNCFVQRSEIGVSLYYVKMSDSNEYLLSIALGRVTDSMDLITVITKSLTNKLRKLNTNYTLKATNDLALVIEKTVDYQTMKDDMIYSKIYTIKNTIMEIYQDTKDLKYHFDTIYILFWDALVILYTKDWSYQIIYICDELRNSVMKELLNL